MFLRPICSLCTRHLLYHRPLSISLFFLLFLSPALSSFNTTDLDDGDGNDEEYTQIYVAMIIIFSVLFLLVICCLLYRIYKKRKDEERQNAKGKHSTGGVHHSGGSNANDHEHRDKEHLPQPEQVKFRGSMSSVEHRHERIPSKPVVIAITTPKGTRHVADAFGDYDGDSPEANGNGGGRSDESGDPDLPGIHEDAEEEYNGQRSTSNHSESQSADREHIHSQSKEEDDDD